MHWPQFENVATWSFLSTAPTEITAEVSVLDAGDTSQLSWPSFPGINLLIAYQTCRSCYMNTETSHFTHSLIEDKTSFALNWQTIINIILNIEPYLTILAFCFPSDCTLSATYCKPSITSLKDPLPSLPSAFTAIKFAFFATPNVLPAAIPNKSQVQGRWLPATWVPWPWLSWSGSSSITVAPHCALPLNSVCWVWIPLDLIHNCNQD